MDLIWKGGLKLKNNGHIIATSRHIMSANAKISNTSLLLISFLNCLIFNVLNWILEIGNIGYRFTYKPVKQTYIARQNFCSEENILGTQCHTITICRIVFEESNWRPHLCLISLHLFWCEVCPKQKMLKKVLSVRVVSPNKIAHTLLYKKLLF